MNVDDPDLEPRLLAALERLAYGRRVGGRRHRKTVVKNLKLMARMGIHFEEEVQRRYPDFPDSHRRLELGRLLAADASVCGNWWNASILRSRTESRRSQLGSTADV